MMVYTISVCLGWAAVPWASYQCRECFSRHRGLAISTCITACTWLTSRDASWWCKNSPRLSTQFPTHRWHPTFVRPIPDFPVAHKHTWRRRHWSHHSQTVAQHSAGFRHTDPLHTITSWTHDCQNTPGAISFSAAHVYTVRAPGPEDKACPSNLPVSNDAPAQSQHTHFAGASQPTTALRGEGGGGAFCIPCHTLPRFLLKQSTLSRTWPVIERVRPMSLHSPEVRLWTDSTIPVTSG